MTISICMEIKKKKDFIKMIENSSFGPAEYDNNFSNYKICEGIIKNFLNNKSMNSDDKIDQHDVMEILEKYNNYLKLRNYIIPKNMYTISCDHKNDNIGSCIYCSKINFRIYKPSSQNDYSNERNNVENNKNEQVLRNPLVNNELFCNYHKIQIKKLNYLSLNNINMKTVRDLDLVGCTNTSCFFHKYRITGCNEKKCINANNNYVNSCNIESTNDGKDDNNDKLDGDEINGDEINGDEINGDEINGDEINGDNLNNDNLNNDNLNNDQLNDDQLNDDNLNNKDEPNDKQNSAYNNSLKSMIEKFPKEEINELFLKECINSFRLQNNKSRKPKEVLLDTQQLFNDDNNYLKENVCLENDKEYNKCYVNTHKNKNTPIKDIRKNHNVNSHTFHMNNNTNNNEIIYTKEKLKDIKELINPLNLHNDSRIPNDYINQKNIYENNNNNNNNYNNNNNNYNNNYNNNNSNYNNNYNNNNNNNNNSANVKTKNSRKDKKYKKEVSFANQNENHSYKKFQDKPKSLKNKKDTILKKISLKANILKNNQQKKKNSKTLNVANKRPNNILTQEQWEYIEKIKNYLYATYLKEKDKEHNHILNSNKNSTNTNEKEKECHNDN
ncbi:hypothetical protein PFLG_02752 [Plasmodium falciparum RAJ116]|uniref:Uncharacterized protein n=1 Tax=Plasmodium falciparum RAJ116 TaxID=580058 RepID=A0A0L0D1Y7_PLAFA|nr:hypothetical protein PFLG_02752 [Plasmodium falciparum RAJ116]